MEVLCVIPSRIGSTRLPRKPLSLIQGKPMVQLVYENASRCALLEKVVVATDSSEIAEVIENCGGKVELTTPDLPTGSDRVAAVAKLYPEMEVIINLQGDEPFVTPKMLETLIAPFLAGKPLVMTTLATPLEPERDYADPNIVKVITNLHGDALYFSRSPIPYLRANNSDVGGLLNLPVYHHVGVYAFKREFLLQYTEFMKTPLEVAESLEQLRVLEHGHQIRVCFSPFKTLEVNNIAELAAAQLFASGINQEGTIEPE